jgi:hypothetical protein
MVLERGWYYSLLLWGHGADNDREQKKYDLATVLFFARTFAPQVEFQKAARLLFLLYRASTIENESLF